MFSTAFFIVALLGLLFGRKPEGCVSVTTQNYSQRRLKMSVRRVMGSMFAALAMIGLMVSACNPIRAQTITESNESCSEGFLNDYWNVDWTVNWNIPPNLSNPGMFTYAKAVARFKLSNGTYQAANDVTVQSYSSGQRTGNVNFSAVKNIPLLFLNQMPNGAVQLEFKIYWVSTINWTGGFATTGYNETGWPHVHVY